MSVDAIEMGADGLAAALWLLSAISPRLPRELPTVYGGATAPEGRRLLAMLSLQSKLNAAAACFAAVGVGAHVLSRLVTR